MNEPQSDNRVFDAVWRVVRRRTYDRAMAATELLDEMLHSYGVVRRSETELFAGDRNLNQDRTILSRFARATSLGIAVYLGNRRIATATVVDAGTAPELGGYADAVLVDTVLRKREVFRGTIELQGTKLLVACRPLYASHHDDREGPIGMLEAFQDEERFFELIHPSVASPGDGETADLDSRADQMASIIRFCDDVARRLQLLALNGNIIAAQAGEQGRAFRVVCRELSALAEQAKDTVGEVEQLTTEMGLGRDAAGRFGSVPPEGA